MNIRRGLFRLVAFTVVIGLGGTAYVTRDRWQPLMAKAIAKPATDEHSERGGHGLASHADHDHGNEAATDKLTLSDQARQNLGLELAEVELTDHWRMVEIPAQVTEEPGHCEQGISATVYGVILKIHAYLGQTVHSGDPLFDVQLTSELLATAQSSLLKTLQDGELIEQEIKRLTPGVENGAIPQARLIEKEYERRRNEAMRLVQSQELLVRGLSSEQVDHIAKTRSLLRELTIRVPSVQSVSTPRQESTTVTVESEDGHHNESHGTASAAAHHHGATFTVEEINVHLGKLVQIGDEMMHLARHEQLMIEGRAFESDFEDIQRVLAEGWSVTARFPSGETKSLERTGLSILYVDNVVDEVSHALRFFVPLKNEVVRDNPGANGLTYRTWQFKPGQAARLLLPTERLPQRIVLPAEAVVREGANAFVFRVNGRRLERTAVRIEHLDSRQVVIAHDGTLTPGFDVVAKNQAYQLNLELKKSSDNGGGGHSHAGHEH